MAGRELKGCVPLGAGTFLTFDLGEGNKLCSLCVSHYAFY